MTRLEGAPGERRACGGASHALGANCFPTLPTEEEARRSPTKPATATATAARARDPHVRTFRRETIKLAASAATAARCHMQRLCVEYGRPTSLRGARRRRRRSGWARPLAIARSPRCRLVCRSVARWCLLLAKAPTRASRSMAVKEEWADAPKQRSPKREGGVYRCLLCGEDLYRRPRCRSPGRSGKQQTHAELSALAGCYIQSGDFFLVSFRFGRDWK